MTQMTLKEFQNKNNVVIKPKSKSWPMKLIGFFSKKFMLDFWTVYRLPFGKPTITHPDAITDPLDPKYTSTIEHEMIHVEDLRSAWGLFKAFWLVWLLPLPVLFSGRWYLERHAYLHNIINHRYPIDAVVDALWNGYLWPWPKSMMTKWFEEKVEEHKKSKGVE